eukprot:4876401-Prymnesium_polylepis.1
MLLCLRWCRFSRDSAIAHGCSSCRMRPPRGRQPPLLPRCSRAAQSRVHCACVRARACVRASPHSRPRSRSLRPWGRLICPQAAAHHVTVEVLPGAPLDSTAPATPPAAARSHAVLQWLLRPRLLRDLRDHAQPRSGVGDAGSACDVVHLVDVAAEAYYALLAQRQRLALTTTALMLHVHAPLAWRLRRDGTPLSSPELAASLHMEREAIAAAPSLVSSRYMVAWLDATGWRRHDAAAFTPPLPLHAVLGTCVGMRGGRRDAALP